MIGLAKRALRLIGPARPEDIAAEIAAIEQQAAEARADAERLAATSADELDDDRAEDMLRQSRAADRAARRAEARLPELRERLDAAKWAAKADAFEGHRRTMAAAARAAIDAMEKAAHFNAILAQARANAIGECGAGGLSCCPSAYGGLVLPDLVALWVRQAERQLEQLDGYQQPPRPPAPKQPQQPAPTDAAGPPRPATPPAEILVPAPDFKAPESATASAPEPRPKREPLRDPPPTDADHVQVLILSAGSFALPDGRAARIGDRVNVPRDVAQKFLERGCANIVEPPPAPIVGDVAAEAELELTATAAGATSEAPPRSRGGRRKQ